MKLPITVTREEEVDINFSLLISSLRKKLLNNHRVEDDYLVKIVPIHNDHLVVPIRKATEEETKKELLLTLMRKYLD